MRVSVHTLWPVAEHSPELTEEALTRLVSYTTRYGQTLGIVVHAVGGINDHLHVLLDLPPTMTLQQVLDELPRATARFLSDVLKLKGFAWAVSDGGMESVSPENVAFLASYVSENASHHADGTTLPEQEFGVREAGETTAAEDEVPAWLREAMPLKDMGD